MFSFFLQTHILSVRVSKGRANPGWDVLLSLCPGTKIFPCPGTRAGAKIPGQTLLSRDKITFPKKTKKQEKDILKQEIWSFFLKFS